MKKILALVLALVLCLGMIPAQAEAAPVKVGIMVPVSTHAWVSGISYHAAAYAAELEAAGTIEYKLYTSSNAEEMTTQIDEAMLWGAQALVIAPQWTGMEVSAQAAINDGLVVVAFDMDIPAEGIYKVTGDNESMGVAGAEYIVEKIGTTGKVAPIEVPSSGSVNELRLKGYGMPQINTNIKGDLIAHVRVEIPRKLNDKQKELLRQFEDSTTGKEYESRKSFLDRVKEIFS